MLALEEFSRLRQLPDFSTCTDRLQTWNQPRPRKLLPIPVEDMRTRKHEIKTPKIRSAQQSRTVSEFDPRPEATDPTALENLRCRLLQLDKPCSFTQLLIPSVDKIEHDHSYYNNSDTSTATEMKWAHGPDQPKQNIIDARAITSQKNSELNPV